MARLSTLSLSTSVALPAFMPVATYAAMKAIRLGDVHSEMILSNTYHCRALGNLKELNGWKRGLLTDSGGFQIGSLSGAQVAEEGVVFAALDSENAAKHRATVFTPEQSITVQNRLGADIIMQLDDVVPPGSPKVEEAMRRSLRWLARCFSVHKTDQLLFPIVQGGLDLRLRDESIAGIFEHDFAGIAIGGLCGGESKSDFCKVVFHCTKAITKRNAAIPIYVMGVGYPEDVVVCVALGCDMMDCVYPTRTARFGKMLTDGGDINVNKLGEIAAKGAARTGGAELFVECSCSTCARHSLEYLHSIRGTTNFCMLLTVHNLHYMAQLGKRMRCALENATFPAFVAGYVKTRFRVVPEWIVEALGWVGIAPVAD